MSACPRPIGPSGGLADHKVLPSAATTTTASRHPHRTRHVPSSSSPAAGPSPVLDRLRKGKHLLKDERLARLSPQEERILELVSAGRTNKQIGEELHLAEKTVKNYVSSILAKLEVTRRAEAASYLTRHTTTPGS
jgi:DNA-binding NarL/FixJ family response regulator